MFKAGFFEVLSFDVGYFEVQSFEVLIGESSDCFHRVRHRKRLVQKTNPPASPSMHPSCLPFPTHASGGVRGVADQFTPSLSVSFYVRVVVDD